MLRSSVVAVGLAVALAACGSPDRAQHVDGRVSGALVDAATATQGAGAARLVFHGTVEGMPGSTEPMKSTGFGEVDPASKRVHLVMKLGKSPILGDLGTMEMVGEGLVMYMKWPLFQTLAPELKPWLKMDLDAIGDKMGLDLSSLMQLGSQNPLQSLDYLWGATSVEDVGAATLHGVKTTHYKAIIDLRLAAEQLPDGAGDLSSTIDKLVELTGQEKIPVEVWVDGQDLLRRMKMTFDWSNADPSLHMPGTMVQVTDYVKYGIEADIELPPPGRVSDLMELIEQSGSGTSS